MAKSIPKQIFRKDMKKFYIKPLSVAVISKNTAIMAGSGVTNKLKNGEIYVDKKNLNKGQPWDAAVAKGYSGWDDELDDL